MKQGKLISMALTLLLAVWIACPGMASTREHRQSKSAPQRGMMSMQRHSSAFDMMAPRSKFKSNSFPRKIVSARHEAADNGDVTLYGITNLDGIPSDWTLIDNDGNKLSPDVARFGFSQGDSWIAYQIASEDNAVACSTSWYAVPGTSSDWMILPDLEVEEASVLSWRAKAADKRFRDGYAVYVAPAGSVKPGDFKTDAPLYSVEAEEGSWTNHTVSLSQFAGQTVSIAFVNNSTDCQCLFVDDITAGISSPLTFESTISNFAVIGRNMQISGFLLAHDSESLKGAKATLEIDGKTFTADFPDIAIEPGQRVPFDWTTDYIPSAKGDRQFTLTINAGNLNCQENGEVRAVAHKAVVEEGTGTWCSWCVRGIVAMNTMREKYPDNFIGIAIHANDAMALDNYTIQDVFNTSGVPKAKVNRGEGCDPLQAEGHLARCLGVAPEAALDFSLNYDKSTGRVEIDTDVSFEKFYSDKDYRLAYVVIENDVHHPDDIQHYSQANAYSGGGEGPMGGYEDLPQLITADKMWFQEVARGLMSPLGGVADVIPHSMKALETVRHHYSFTLPANIDNVDKVEAIVMLIDNESGKIINAECARLAGNSAVESIADDNLRITSVPGELHLEGADILESRLYGIDGRLIAHDTDTLSFDATGVAILTVDTPAGTLLRKVLLRK